MLSLGDRFLKSLEEERESLTESLTRLTRWIESRVFLREIFCESVMMKNLFFPSSSSSSSFSLENRTNTLTEETRVKSFEKIVRSKAPPSPPLERDKSMEHRFQSLFTNFSNFLPPPRILAPFAQDFSRFFVQFGINIYIYIYIVSIRNHLIRVANERMRNGTTHRLA